MNRNNRGMTASTPPHNSAPAGDAPDVVYPTLGQMRLRGHLDYTVIGNDCHYLNDGNRRYLAVGPLDDEGPLATQPGRTPRFSWLAAIGRHGSSLAIRASGCCGSTSAGVLPIGGWPLLPP